MGREFAVNDNGGAKRQPRRLLGPKVAALGARQHGVVARRQLQRLGLSPRQVGYLIRSGALHRIHQGVYAVGHTRLTREGRWMAAVLGGGRAVLSYQSAGVHWRLLSSGPSLPHVTIPTRGRRGAGIHRHTAVLPEDEVTVRDGIPVTTVARTLLDLAAVLPPDRLERAIAEAEYQRHGDSPSLPELVERHRGRRGLKGLRSILARRLPELGITRSVLEERFLRFLDSRGFERPELNAALELGPEFIEDDCLWRRAEVAAELDGRAAHLRARTFESDRVRDRRLQVAGWKPVRITGEQLTVGANQLEADLTALGVDRDNVRP